MWKDKIVEEVRKVRAKHAAQFKYDLNAIYNDLKRQEKQGKRKTISFTPKKPRDVNKTKAS